MKFCLTLLTLLCIVFNANAQTPTVHSNNLVVQVIGCHSLNLGWLSGNGNYRLVVVEQDSTATFTPTNSTVYANGQIMGNAQLFVTQQNNLIVDNLNAGATYTIYIYEYNNMAMPEYLTSTGYPQSTVSMENIVISGLRDPVHVCQYDSITYSATAVHSKGLPVSTIWYYGNGDSTNKSHSTIQHKTYGIFTAIFEAQSTGCFVSRSLRDTVAPKPLADFILDPDTPGNNAIQCIKNNRFILKNHSINYYLGTPEDQAKITWDWGDGTSSFSYNGEHFYTSSGNYTINLYLDVSKHNNLQVYCSDTATMQVQVKAPIDSNKVMIEHPGMAAGDSLRFSYTGPSFIYWVLADSALQTDTIYAQDTSLHMPVKGTYMLSLETGNVCGAHEQEIKVLAPNFSVDLGPDIVLDKSVSDSVRLHLPEGFIYDWSTGASTSSILIKSELLAIGNFTVWGKVIINPDWEVSDSVNVQIVDKSSVASIEKLEIECVPNPAQDFVSLSADKPCTYSIYTMQGQLIKTESQALHSHHINISAFESGMYYILVQSGDSRSSLNLLKN